MEENSGQLPLILAQKRRRGPVFSTYCRNILGRANKALLVFVLLGVAAGVWIVFLVPGMVILVGSMVLLAVLALWKLPQYQARAALRHNPDCDVFKVENDARATLAQALGGLFLIAGLAASGMQIKQTQQEAAATRASIQEGQVQERYTTALEQLNSPDMEVVIGAIYSLEQIALDSPEDAFPIMELLATYVRDHTEPEHEQAADHESSKPENDRLDPPRPDPDVQAAMTVIARGRWQEWWPDQTPPASPLATCLDLKGAYLAGLRIVDATLPPLCLENANLTQARLVRSDLTGARLRNADLSGAMLVNVDLTAANLMSTNLSSAWLIGVTLRDAVLHETDLSETFVSGTMFDGADMELAALDDAQIVGGTCVPDAMRRENRNQMALLEQWGLLSQYPGGSDLRGAVNLSQEQIDSAELDKSTQLPSDLVLKPKAFCRSAIPPE